MGCPVGQGWQTLCAVNLLQLAILADDLTGACDAAAPFSATGLTTLVTWRLGATPAADVLTVSTDSRHLTEEEATDRNRSALVHMSRIWGGRRPDWIYKKIDSTLRGHPGAELAVIMAVLGTQRALVAPAFPAQGRTTVGGQQRVHGRPLEETDFGRQALTSCLPDAFGRWARGAPIRSIALETVMCGGGAVCQALDVPGPALFVADAETEADLAALAQAARASDLQLLCGSAGLSRALTLALDLTPAVAAPALPARAGGPVLVVAGSRHPRTIGQVETARQQGAAVVRARELVGANAGEPAPAETILRAAAFLAEGRDVILTTAGLGESPLGSLGLAERLGQMVSALLAARQIGGLVLTGGEVALAACLALGSTTLWMQGEVEPGAVVGRLVDGRWPGLPVVTKAGGFGTDQALALAIERLHAKDTPAQPAGVKGGEKL